MNSLIVAFFVTTGSPQMAEAGPGLAGCAEVRPAVAAGDEASAPFELVQPAVRTFDISAPTFDPSKPRVIA